MTKRWMGALAILCGTMGLSGCSAIGDKNTSLSIIYGVTAVLAVALLIGYCGVHRRKNWWFTLLFSAVSVVNVGYFCLSISSSLGEALWANRLAYLGSVLLPFSMLMIICRVTNTSVKRWVPWCLLTLSAVVLFVAASPGWLDIYYKEVSFEIVNGTAVLTKEYGPLHPLYLVYLVGYFASMIVVIVRAQKKKTIDTTVHAVVIAVAVLVNIGVWLIEQLVKIDFEMLSVSYIISEVFLLGVHMVMAENQRLRAQIRREVSALPSEEPAPDAAEDAALLFLRGYELLTPREHELFEAYAAGKSTKEILETLGIKENTLKYHSRNLYGKLGVSSRKQLAAVYAQLSANGSMPPKK